MARKAGLMRRNTAQLLRIGFFADGVFKAVVAVVMLVLLEPITRHNGAPAWLLLLTVLAVSISAVAEIAYAARNGTGTHTKYLVAYDAGWFLATAAALFLVFGRGAEGWTLWLSYQVIASPIIAIVFFRGSRPGP